MIPGGSGIDVTEYSLGTRNSAESLELRQSLGIPNDAFIAMFVGRLQLDKGLVEFVDAAPCNRSDIIRQPPRFSGCGSILIRAAIEFSKLEGYKGRIGLHSLPQSNSFYANKIGMTDLGPDPDYQNLRYFEMTPAQAEAFIKEGG